MLKTRPSDTSQLEERPATVRTIPFPPLLFSAPSEAFTNLSEIATANVEAAWRRWADLLENHVDFASRLFDAFLMNARTSVAACADQTATSASGSTASDRAMTKTRKQPSSPSSTPAKLAVVKDLPIKRYDELSVPMIASKMGRLRDADQIRHVLTYEARNKRRKGVAAAGKVQLERLAYEN